jgi:cobalt-zinc-cadmium efflux system membrane fusion protein
MIFSRPSENPGWWRKTAGFGAVAALGAAIAVAAQHVDLASRAADAKSDPKPPSEARSDSRLTLSQEQVRQISVEPVQAVQFEPHLQAIGQIAYNEDLSTPVPSPYSGRIVRAIAKLGDEVQPGAPLFEIESPDIVQAQSDFIAALGAMAKAKTAFEQAKRVAARQQELHKGGAIAQKDWEQAQADLHTAETELKSTTGAYSGARERLRLLGRSDAEIARLEQDRRADPIAVVRAPIAGTVTLRKVGPGQWVRQDMADSLFAISDLSSMWLVAKVPETEIGAIRLGQRLEVQVPAFPDERFAAKVSYIGPSVDPATHRVVVRSYIENPGRKLKPEMFANFRIVTREEGAAPSVPVSALVRDIDQTEVWVEQGEGQFERRRVEVGLQQQGRVQILKGLQPGERVVTRGGVYLTQALIASR